MSGAADDVIKYVMEQYFKAEAKSEEKLLEKSGEGAAEGFLYVLLLSFSLFLSFCLFLSSNASRTLFGFRYFGEWKRLIVSARVCNRKDRLKKNPVVSNDELNSISGGLGDEAAKEFGNGGGLGKGIGKAFD